MTSTEQWAATGVARRRGELHRADGDRRVGRKGALADDLAACLRSSSRVQQPARREPHGRPSLP